MHRRGSHGDVLERAVAQLVQVEEPLDVHGAHLGGELVGDGREIVGEEMGRDGDGEGLEAVVGGKSVGIDWAVRRLNEDEVIEGRVRGGEVLEWDAVLDERIGCGLDRV